MLTLGIVGGGQLALMLARSASQLGMATVCLEKSGSCPASLGAKEVIVGDWNRADDLHRLAERCDVITIEHEFVDADVLEQIENGGCQVVPSARTLRLVQDKLHQKQHLAAAGIASPEFVAITDEASLESAARQLGLPLVLKRRRNGYDGTGNATVRTFEELLPAAAKLGGVAAGLLAEAWCPFEKEIAVMITRSAQGECAIYPVVETRQKNHVCHEVIAPATLAESTAQEVRRIARRAAEAVGIVGSMGVELFLLPDGSVRLNELAPRVHNSGHYTIEGCECSQFENHIRAIAGMPLGSPQSIRPAAMVNLLGDRTADGRPSGVREALTQAGAHIHLYGKSNAAPGRKMGHVTALGSTTDEALAIARRAADGIRFDQPLST